MHSCIIAISHPSHVHKGIGTGLISNPIEFEVVKMIIVNDRPIIR